MKEESNLEAMIQRLRDALGLQSAKATELGSFPAFQKGWLYVAEDDDK